MSFGDLLGLLLFVVFIVLPAVGRMQRRGPGVPPPGAPRAPGQGAPGRAGGPVVPAGQPATTAQPADLPFPPLDDDDELARRLAAARERVRQAMGERSGSSQAGGAPSPPRPTVGAPTPPRPTVGGPGDPRLRPPRPLVSADRDDGLLRTPLAPAEAVPRSPRPTRPSRPPMAARATMAARRLSSEAPAVVVERLDDSTGRRRPFGPVLSFDGASVRDGLVWHQILGAPRARRRLGGGPFPER